MSLRKTKGNGHMMLERVPSMVLWNVLGAVHKAEGMLMTQFKRWSGVKAILSLSAFSILIFQ